MPLLACKCPSCSADLSFDDTKDMMYCSYCGTRVIKEQIINVNVLNGVILRDEEWYYKNLRGLFGLRRYEKAIELRNQFFDDFPCGVLPKDIERLFELYPIAVKYDAYDSFAAYFEGKCSMNGYSYLQALEAGLAFNEEIFSDIKSEYLLDISKLCEFYGYNKADKLKEVCDYENKLRRMFRERDLKRTKAKKKSELDAEVKHIKKLGFIIGIVLIILIICLLPLLM